MTIKKDELNKLRESKDPTVQEIVKIIDERTKKDNARVLKNMHNYLKNKKEVKTLDDSRDC